MISNFENKDRKVIPNFRSLNATIGLGELDGAKEIKAGFEKGDLSTYIEDFKSNTDLGYASDLISAAIVNNELSDRTVIEAAHFVLERKNKTTTLQNEAAGRILNVSTIGQTTTAITKLEEFIQMQNSPELFSVVKSLKARINTFDRNPFLYAELARIYSVFGHQEKAIKNIHIAKQLAPNNRYILRSFARLLAHYGDIEQAHNGLRKNPLTKVDPWLLASEIAFSSLRNKNSNFIKYGNAIIESQKFQPFSISELASSLGTVELLNGSRKKSRAFFVSALECPNDNSLAQVEWANNKEKYFDLNIADYKNSNNYEALTLEGYNLKSWGNCLMNAEKWFLDTPFSSRPIMYGHHVASLYLENHETAIQFCKAGLISNSHDPMLLNNIAYSLCMLDRAPEAFQYLNKVHTADVKDETTKICLQATTGLAHYRNGNVNSGQELYLKAITDAKEKGLKRYYNVGLINMAMEEIRFNSSLATEYLNEINQIPDTDNEELQIRKKRFKEFIAAIIRKQNV